MRQHRRVHELNSGSKGTTTQAEEDTTQRQPKTHKKLVSFFIREKKPDFFTCALGMDIHHHHLIQSSRLLLAACMYMGWGAMCVL